MKTRSTYWQLLPYIRSQWSTIAKALACTLAFTVFWPILAMLAGQMATYIGEGNVGALAQLAGLAAVIFLIRGSVQYGQDALMAKAALKITLDLRKQVYAHLQQLSLSYFVTAKTGDLSYRLTEDIDRIGEVINKVFHQFIPCVLQLLVVIGYMIWLNWQLTLATLIIAPLMALLISWFGERLLSFSHRSQASISNLSALLTELFEGIRLVKAFAAEEYAINRFSFEAEHNRQAKYLAERIKALQFVVVGFLEAMSVLLLFFLGGWQISVGNLTGAGFISYVTAVALLIDPISLTTSNYSDFKQGEASCDRVFELLAIQPEVLEKPGAIPLPPITGKVEYRNVTFAYSNQEKSQTSSSPCLGSPVLQNLNLLVMPGEAIALVGASGAGKTTLVNLLPRFYDPQAGEILIDGINIKDVTLRSLRRQIGIVPQDINLFSGSIAQNIAFGQTQFDLKEVQAAAEIANAHEFIAKLPDGYHTKVGERGVNLSGGQRQRIAIARAVFLNPRILILDEATSALDSESEALVQQALERLMQNRTVFIIAHRLASVRRAARILVMEQGRIIESGTHQQLLEKGGRYARFYAQQFI
ncbi:MAG: ABC transporter ATP-binding protein/permease [Oscillatoriaceae bacterium SKW80]|nr:ABC transporter ATP-binding protein/permease [Oscillatoriaceae bacterium SKYG93]MCX8122069.1 ABC transporter ATP-binding protein/permease [Oscillatoriaceae bacterium SKW80]MDW8454356.1 ABC transporter ATP-binding protein [Oscillatoriaceae cyanobacterium SKYGB_i_bin93]HIK29221.1 ABC transporter ATP-binding protein [Oscillatoriaceae cyanobacterium M7585_C2015_266]